MYKKLNHILDLKFHFFYPVSRWESKRETENKDREKKDKTTSVTRPILKKKEIKWLLHASFGTHSFTHFTTKWETKKKQQSPFRIWPLKLFNFVFPPPKSHILFKRKGEIERKRGR